MSRAPIKLGNNENTGTLNADNDIEEVIKEFENQDQEANEDDINKIIDEDEEEDDEMADDDDEEEEGDDGMDNGMQELDP